MSLTGQGSFLSATPRQIVVIVVSFSAFFAWYGYVQYSLRAHRAELQALAEGEVSSFFNGMPKEEFDVLSLVESNREFAVLGSEWGNVRVYLRKKGDATMASFLGVEYFYRHDGEKWERTDMAKMDDPKDWPEAYDAFVARGHSVDESAYDRTLR
jgi:hypothetical protein